MSRFEGGVFSRTSFSIIPVADNDPLDPSFLVVTCCGRDGVKFASHEILHLIGFSVGCVDCAD